jgi:hypothetical protein
MSAHVATRQQNYHLIFLYLFFLLLLTVPEMIGLTQRDATCTMLTPEESQAALHHVLMTNVLKFQDYHPLVQALEYKNSFHGSIVVFLNFPHFSHTTNGCSEMTQDDQNNLGPLHQRA